MRIVIDMQGAQSTGSRNRGIGRYTLALVDAMISEGRGHTFVLVLNGLFADTIQPLRERYGPKVGLENIRVWTAPSPVKDIDTSLVQNRRVSELIREHFIASLEPNFVLLTSLFEGLDDDAVTSINAASAISAPTAVIFYDLIPLICRKDYLSYPPVEFWYERKLQHLRSADILLAISDATKQDGERYLAIPSDKIINISSAAAKDTFRQIAYTNGQFESIAQKYGVTRPFVMYTGGIDLRKNIESLILSFANIPTKTRNAHQLVIVCSASADAISSLRALAKRHMNTDDLVITGFVSEEELVAFYNNCKLFVFPSWMEGFGLPILEAMQCGAPVIGSNCSATPEVIGMDDALFDPHSVDSMASKLTHVLEDEEYRLKLKEHAIIQASKFDWALSASKALDAMESYVSNKVSLGGNHKLRRPRLAFVSPLPPEHSGIADYSAHLIPDLARHYEIELIVAQKEIATPTLNANFSVRSFEWFRDNSTQYDRIVYQFGNSSFHTHMFSLIAETGGVVVLHDFFLSGISYYREAVGENFLGFWADLYRDHGYDALLARLDQPDIGRTISQYPVNANVLNSSFGVIVHSRHARELARHYYGETPNAVWAQIPSVRAPSNRVNRDLARSRLGISPETYLVCSFGHLADTKLNLETIEAFIGSEAAKSGRGMLVFVGEATGAYKAELEKLIRDCGGKKQIFITGRTVDETYRDYLSAADVAVQLRTNSRGETSAAVLDTMNYGLPTIVSPVGSMAELPEDCVYFLAQGSSAVVLRSALDRLFREPAEGRELGSRAEAFIRKHHMPRAVADAYADAIETFYGRPWFSVPSVIANLRGKRLQLSKELSKSAAVAIARDFKPPFQRNQLLVDVTELVGKTHEIETQKLVACLRAGHATHRVEPVYRDEHGQLRYARSLVRALLPQIELPFEDDLIDFHHGDIFVSADLPETAAGNDYTAMNVLGVKFINSDGGFDALSPAEAI